MGNCCGNPDVKGYEIDMSSTGIERTKQESGYQPVESFGAGEDLFSARSVLLTPTDIALIQDTIRGYLIRKRVTDRLNDWRDFSEDENALPEAGIETTEEGFRLLSRQARKTYDRLPTLMLKRPVRGVTEAPPKKLADGSIYIGQWGMRKDGFVRRGKGKLYSKDGSFREGYWKDGKLHIQGRVIYSNGDYYDGGFASGLRTGSGTYEVFNGKGFYAGDWTDDKKHGYGKETAEDGSSYEGVFDHGAKTGYGTFQWPTGNNYRGQVLDSQLEGEGEYHWKDGSWYKGQWSAGKMHGTGEFVTADGKTYKGGFMSDLKEGYGVYTWNGKVYEGDWAEGKMHGYGVITTSKGSKRYQWKNGEQLAEVPLNVS